MVGVLPLNSHLYRAQLFADKVMFIYVASNRCKTCSFVDGACSTPLTLRRVMIRSGALCTCMEHVQHDSVVECTPLQPHECIAIKTIQGGLSNYDRSRNCHSRATYMLAAVEDVVGERRVDEGRRGT